MSDKRKGDSIGDLGNKNEPAADRLESKSRKQRAGDVGRALRSVYDETLREDVPDDFSKLLGKLR